MHQKLNGRAVRPSGLGRAAAKALFLCGLVVAALALVVVPIARLGVLWFLLLVVGAPWWTFALALIGELVQVKRP